MYVLMMAALQQNPSECEMLGGNKMFTSYSTPTKDHPDVDLEIIYGHNETEPGECEKTLTVAVSKPASSKVDANPAEPVVDKCTKAWWSASKPEDCVEDCGWVVNWKGMPEGVAPPPTPVPKPDDGTGFPIVPVVVGGVAVLLVSRLPSCSLGLGLCSVLAL
jgi:hypothetical protein|eukprot:COSAG06_NODE_925_length_11515_cov_2815.680448_8_plen_162_part_00